MKLNGISSELKRKALLHLLAFILCTGAFFYFLVQTVHTQRFFDNEKVITVSGYVSRYGPEYKEDPFFQDMADKTDRYWFVFKLDHPPAGSGSDPNPDSLYEMPLDCYFLGGPAIESKHTLYFNDDPFTRKGKFRRHLPLWLVRYGDMCGMIFFGLIVLYYNFFRRKVLFLGATFVFAFIFRIKGDTRIDPGDKF